MDDSLENKIDETDERELTEEEKENLLNEAVEKRKNAKERLYDKVPLTYKQVDILTKVLIGILVAMMLYFIVTSRVWG